MSRCRTLGVLSLVLLLGCRERPVDPSSRISWSIPTGSYVPFYRLTIDGASQMIEVARLHVDPVRHSYWIAMPTDLIVGVHVVGLQACASERGGCSEPTMFNFLVPAKRYRPTP